MLSTDSALFGSNFDSDVSSVLSLNKYSKFCDSSQQKFSFYFKETKSIRYVCRHRIFQIDRDLL